MKKIALTLMLFVSTASFAGDLSIDSCYTDGSYGEVVASLVNFSEHAANDENLYLNAKVDGVIHSIKYEPVLRYKSEYTWRFKIPGNTLEKVWLSTETISQVSTDCN